jgi:UDP-N-acetylmuramoyl-tripeptide--D-alanyl-D-alanine ligase
VREKLRIGSGELLLIDESYNANPASVEAALKVLAAQQPRGRRIAVLGDMLELGETSPKLHKALRKPVEDSGAELVFLCGPDMAGLAEDLSPGLLAGHFDDPGQLAQALLPALRDGDIVMLKASNGLKFGSIVQTLLSASAAETAGAR